MAQSPQVRRAGITVLVGSAAGFGLNLLLTPVLSRLFSPEAFGLFATLTAVASVFIGVSTFRLEVLSQRVGDETAGRDLQRLALVTSLLWGVAITAAVGSAMLVWPLSGWWLLTGPLVSVGSLQLIGSAVWTRRRDYRSLAWGNFVQGAASGVIQVVLGWFSPGAGSLVAGFAAARLVWVRALVGERRPRGTLTAAWARSRRFAGVSGLSALVNSGAGQLPILLVSLVLGQAEVGFLAMALRLFVAPLSIVGQAAATANLGEVGRLLRDGDRSAAGLVRRSMRELFLLGLLPCVLVAAVSTQAVPVLLGAQWAPVGPVMAVLAAGALVQFCVSPLSQLLNVTDHGRWLLLWDLARLLLVGTSFAVPLLMGAGLLVAVGVYSAVLCLLYGVMAHLVLRAVNENRVA